MPPLMPWLGLGLRAKGSGLGFGLGLELELELGLALGLGLAYLHEGRGGRHERHSAVEVHARPPLGPLQAAHYAEGQQLVELGGGTLVRVRVGIQVQVRARFRVRGRGRFRARFSVRVKVRVLNLGRRAPRAMAHSGLRVGAGLGCGGQPGRWPKLGVITR